MTNHLLWLLPWVAVIFGVAPVAIRAWNIGAKLADALEAAHVSRKVAAGVMGMTEPDLSRAIAGVGPNHLSADRMTLLPQAVWMHLLLAIGEEFGVARPADERARRLASVEMRAVKARLRRAEKEQAYA